MTLLRCPNCEQTNKGFARYGFQGKIDNSDQIMVSDYTPVLDILYRCLDCTWNGGVEELSTELEG